MEACHILTHNTSVCYDKLVALSKALSRDLKDHMECETSAIKLLDLRPTDMYFLVLITPLLLSQQFSQGLHVSISFLSVFELF